VIHRTTYAALVMASLLLAGALLAILTLIP
jgi:hypothetical protein